jgi:hypothetical protein
MIKLQGNDDGKSLKVDLGRSPIALRGMVVLTTLYRGFMEPVGRGIIKHHRRKIKQYKKQKVIITKKIGKNFVSSFNIHTT